MYANNVHCFSQCIKLAIGKGAVSGRAEVVYDYPDSLQLQEYRPKNDEDIKLKECSAYEKPPDIELEECPAYVEKNKDQDIELEECPAYGHLRAVIIIVTGQCTEFNHIIWNRIKAY